MLCEISKFIDWDIEIFFLSSLTRNWTQAHGSENPES